MIQKTFEAEREMLHEVLAFTEGELEKHDCNMKTQMMIAVMVEEIFVNIASYAYSEGNGSASVKCKLTDHPGEIIICFTKL